VCEARESAVFAAVNGKRLRRCAACGLIFAHPLPSPETIAAFYASEYYDPYLEAREANRLAYGAWLDAIEKRSARGRILDVGCGIGLFLSAARARGWDARGVEPAPWPARYAREEAGLPVETATLEQASLPGESVDVVTLWSTLEHLCDPVSLLREAARVLRPGGALWAAVPNTRSLAAFLRGPREANLAKPEHLLHFTEPTLRRLLTDRAGLADVERVYVRGDVAGPLRGVVRHMARRTNLGSEIRVVARKPGSPTGARPGGAA
jgi:SAM-dependent methyltransferase